MRGSGQAPLSAFGAPALWIGLATLILALAAGALLSQYESSRGVLNRAAALAVSVGFGIAARRRDAFPGLKRGPVSDRHGSGPGQDFSAGALHFVLLVLLLLLPLPDLLLAALLLPLIALIAHSAEPPLGQLDREALLLAAEREVEGLPLPAAPRAAAGPPVWWLGLVIAPSALIVGGAHPDWAGLAPDRRARAQLVQRLETRGHDARELDRFVEEFLDAWDARDREALDHLRHPDAGGGSLFPGSKELPPIRRHAFTVDETLIGQPLPVLRIETRLGNRQIRIVSAADGLSWR